MKTALVLLFSLVASCGFAASKSPLDDAEAAVENHDFGRARELYRQAAVSEASPHRRNTARLRLANIEWRIDHQPAAARATLAGIDAASEDAAALWVERSRIDAELTGDFGAARAAATKAIAAATKREDRMRATLAHAAASVEPVRRARQAHRCTDDAALLGAVAELRKDIEHNGPFLDAVRLLLDAALIANDGPSALAAWRQYYRLGPETTPPAALAEAAKTLGALLPSWRGVSATTDQRRRAGLALADSKLFGEAVLVLTDPCVHSAIAADDRSVKDVIAYEASLRKIAKVTDEYYRQKALGKGNARQFREAVERAELTGLSKHFGAMVNIGTTGGILDLHLAHPVLDERRTVTQYGHSAELHFVSLDGVVSNGFSTWVRDGAGGDGGWATDEVIYQVRPMYADGPLRDWLRVSDNEVRAEQDRHIVEETQRDEERAAQEAIRDFPGLALRLRRQYDDATLAALKAKGLTGDDLRDAFLARINSDTFESSIWAHEGRHAIDRKYALASEASDLEYRAKLSEAAFAPAPRAALTSSILGSIIGSNTPHGIAGKRALEGVTGWMRTHAAEIAGLDRDKPLLPQLDRLTDAQLREAFRSLDPLAPR